MQERWLKRLVEVVIRTHPRILSFYNTTSCTLLTTRTLCAAPTKIAQG
jgi:hypothetical protein